MDGPSALTMDIDQPSGSRDGTRPPHITHDHEIQDTTEGEPKTRKKAPTIAASAWDPHRSKIKHLHIDENRPLEEVMVIMARDHGLIANKRQYRLRISQWGLDKKVKTKEMKQIVEKRQRRKLLEPGKPPLKFKIRGIAVPDEKIERFMKRHDIPPALLYSPSSDASTPSAVGFRSASNGGSPPLNADDEMSISDSPVKQVENESEDDSIPSPVFSEVSIHYSNYIYAGSSPRPTPRLLPSPLESLRCAIRQLDPNSRAENRISFASGAAETTSTMCDYYRTEPLSGRFRQEEADRLQEELRSEERQHGRGDSRTLQPLLNFARLLVDQGRYRSAEATIRRSLESRMPARNRRNNAILLEIWCLHGDILNRLGDFEKGKRLLERILDSSKRSVGDAHPCTIHISATLATTFMQIGAFEEAEKCLTQAVDAGAKLDKEGGVQDIRTAEYLSELADIAHFRGRWKEAEDLAERGTNLGKERLGDEHPITLTCKRGLAFMQHARGAWESAQILARSTLESTAMVLGAEHPQTLDCAYVLVVMCTDQEYLDVAETLGSWLVDTGRKIFGLKHAKTLRFESALASVSCSQQHFSDASRILKRVIAAQSDILGVDHPDVVMSRRILARVFWGRRMYARCWDLFADILSWDRAVLGDKHPLTRRSLYNKALHLSLATDQARLAEAEQILREIIEASRRCLGEDHPDTLYQEALLAEILGKQGHWQAAEILARRLKEKSVEVKGSSHPDTLEISETWKNCLGHVGHHTDTPSA